MKFIAAVFVLLIAFSATCEGANQSIIIPGYFYYTSEYWDDLSPATNELVIGNINNGPGAAYDSAWDAQYEEAEAAGIDVAGYVSTNYGATAIATVEDHIDKWRTWYGITEIFFDETSSDCGDVTYYDTLYDYVKSYDAAARVIINPGASAPECYEPVGDIICNFENTQSVYATWSPSAWVYNYSASKFWHLVYDSASTELTSTIKRSEANHAGYVYITDDSGANPWDTLPAYWNQEVNQIQHPRGGTIAGSGVRGGGVR